MTYEEIIILRVDEETRRWLEAVSQASGLSMSRVVRLILDNVKNSGTIKDGKVTFRKETGWES